MRNRNKYPIELILGGLIGISLVLLQALISLDKPNFFSQISIILFVVALPMLSFSLLIRKQPLAAGKAHKPYTSIRLMTQIGIIACLAGVTAAICHAMPLAGLAFIASGLVAFLIYIKVINDLKSNDQLEQESDNPSDVTYQQQLQKINDKDHAPLPR